MSGLREFINALEENGFLCRKKYQVDWKYELGAIARAENKPILFENIKDYPGKRIFVNGLSSYASIGLAVGIDSHANNPKSLSKIIRQAFSKPIDPVMIDKSPLTENKITEQINLTVLPVPWWSEIDAGRYIGTWHLNITRDPESKVRNVGIYRMQLLGPKIATVSVSPRSHLAEHIKKAEKLGKELPMAVAIGVDERLIIAAAASPAYGVDELALPGGLLGKPVELFRCLTQPLEVPADSEIVIEGYIKPGIHVQDGPFLDYAGIPNTNPSAYLFEATGLFFRHNCIFRGTAVGNPGAEDHILYSVLAHAGLADFHGSRLRRLIQNFLLKHRAFRLFQYSGRIGSFIRKAETRDKLEEK